MLGMAWIAGLCAAVLVGLAGAQRQRVVGRLRSLGDVGSHGGRWRRGNVAGIATPRVVRLGWRLRGLGMGVASADDVDAALSAICARLRAGAGLQEAFEDYAGFCFATPGLTVRRIEMTLRSHGAGGASDSGGGAGGASDMGGAGGGRTGEAQMPIGARIAGTLKAVGSIRSPSNGGDAVSRAAHSIAWACALSAESGCDAALCLDAVRSECGRQRDAQRAADQALAMPRATMRILMALPVLTLLAGEAMGAHPLAFVLGNPAGWAVLALGMVFEVCGVAWMRWLVRGFDERVDFGGANGSTAMGDRGGVIR